MTVCLDHSERTGDRVKKCTGERGGRMMEKENDRVSGGENMGISTHSGIQAGVARLIDVNGND